MKNSTKLPLILVSSIASVVTLTSCHFGGSGASAWETVLAKCVSSDLQKSKPLYFGAANINGVGSIWSLDPATGDYWPTSQLKDLGAPKNIVRNYLPIQCSGAVSNGLTFDVNGSAKPVIFPLSADISAQLGKASSITVKVDYIVQEDANTDNFNNFFQNLPLDGAVMKGVERGNRYVVARAWKAGGFKAILTYDNNAAIEAKLALDKKTISGSLGLTTKLTNSSTLEVSTKDEIYVAGVLRKLTLKDGLSSGDGQVVREEVPAQANATIRPPE